MWADDFTKTDKAVCLCVIFFSAVALYDPVLSLNFEFILIQR